MKGDNMTAPRSDADVVRAWLDEKDALASKATKGPWKWREEHPEFMLPYASLIAPDGCHFSCEDKDGVRIYRDTPFIADSRTSLPAALEMVRVLMEALEDAASQLLVDAGDTEPDYLPGASCARDTITDALARVRRIAEGK